MIDFEKLRAEQAAFKAWRDANPGPLVWVTNVRQPLARCTPDQGKFTPHVYTYVGRDMGPRSLFRGSPLGNPYRGDGAISRYASWISGRMTPEHEEFQELLKLLGYACEPRGVSLGCWCTPAPCHADVIRETILGMYAAGWRPEHAVGARDNATRAAKTAT